MKIKFFEAIKKTVAFSVTIIGFRMVGTINAFLSMWLISSLGKTELAMCAFINMVQTTIYTTGWFVLFAVSTLTGYYVGKDSNIDIGKVFQQGCLASLILGIPMTFIFWYTPQILHLLGENKDLIGILQPYFHVLAFSALPGMFYVTFMQFVIGIGKSKIALCFSTLNLVLLLLPSYLLIHGKFGLPKLGIISVAYSMVFVYALGFAIAFFYLFCKKSYKKYQIFSYGGKFDYDILKKIFKIGIPISIQVASELLVFSFSIIMIGWIGQSSLAAAQILNQLNMIMIMGPYGISLASNVLISKAFGKGDKYSIRVLGNAGIVTGIIFTFSVAIIYLIFPKNLISLYAINLNDPSNAKIIGIAVLLFFIGSFSQIFDGIRNIIIGALRGLQDTVIPMWYGIAACWIIGAPLGYLLGIKFNYGAPGIGVSFLVSWIACTFALAIRFYRKTNTQIVM